MTQQTIETLEQTVHDCTLCELHLHRTQAVFGGGNPTGKIMLIGEAPGFEEDKIGKVFVGKSGQLLDEILLACLPYLIQQIEIIQPAMMVTLGATALKALFGGEMRITRQRGNWLLWNQKIPVMPTYHPSALLRNPGLKRDA